ncbi:MAG TPA: hypothetical protein VEH84_02945 [Alphaproteobacteria bacterium]|nr:hypothetical protein [Alphaproteobacteria bacterium]
MAAEAAKGGGRSGRRWRIAAWGGGAALLLLPLAGMQVSAEVAWGPGDFVLAAALIGGVGLAFELAARAAPNRTYLAAVAVALATAFILVWANLAVGIVGAEDNPANRMYGGVLAVGAAGAAIARFRPRGMALALIATAAAQVLVAVIALMAGLGSAGAPTAAFAALWLASAWLFHRAARERASA